MRPDVSLKFGGTKPVDSSIFDSREPVNLKFSTVQKVHDSVVVKATNYEELKNKPMIENVELMGNHNMSDFGVDSLRSLKAIELAKKAFE